MASGYPEKERKTSANIHVYVILPKEHKQIFSIFNYEQVYEAVDFQMSVLRKHVQRCKQPYRRLLVMPMLTDQYFYS